MINLVTKHLRPVVFVQGMNIHRHFVDRTFIHICAICWRIVPIIKVIEIERGSIMTFSRKLFLVASSLVVLSAAPAVAGDAAKGEKLFKRCAACHSLDAGVNKVGPSLAGSFGRECGTVEGYKYGKGYLAACEKGFTADEAFLTDYLKDPSAKLSEVAGSKQRSKMAFKLKKDSDIADVIEFLKTQ
ncbi:c-type cytochrome [Thalassospira sp.]|uniref:c-type cytochrome n=1 Tax=Thalassospira sp. TaxID=1912094 RepID=UPI003AA9E163